MVSSTRENWQFAEENNVSLREACLANCITKLAKRFEESGTMMS